MPVWINGQEWGTVQFPNREYQFKTVDFKRKNRIVVQWKDSNDITKLLMLLSYYKKSTAWWEKELELLMPYLPYSRADRYTSQQEIPTIELLGDLLKPYPISSIGVMSPHSDASDVCLDRLVHIPTFLMAIDEVSTRTVFENIVFKHNIDCICYPDKGAQKRYGSVIGYEKYSFHGDKVRGDGGKLSDFRLVDAPDLTGKSVLIIDDICSKGGTAYNTSLDGRFFIGTETGGHYELSGTERNTRCITAGDQQMASPGRIDPSVLLRLQLRRDPYADL